MHSPYREDAARPAGRDPPAGDRLERGALTLPEPPDRAPSPGGTPRRPQRVPQRGE